MDARPPVTASSCAMLIAVMTVLAASAPVKMAAPGFQAVGVEQQLVDAWVERLATLLGTGDELRVISAKDIAQIVGFERQKELIGCSDKANSCLVELAGALGVDAILSGTVAKGSGSITATMRVLKTSDGTTLWSGTERLRNEEDLQDWLDAQAPLIRARVRAAMTALDGSVPAEAVSTAAPSRRSPIVTLVPAIAGVVIGAVGVGLVVGSRGSSSALRTGTFDSDDAIRQTTSTGRGLESGGYAMLGVGLVAIAASIAWLLGSR